MSSNNNMADFGTGRKPSYHAAAAYHPPSNYGHNTSQAQNQRNAQYLSAGVPMMPPPHNHNEGLVGLAHGFTSMSLNSNYTPGNNRGNSLVAAPNADYPMPGPIMYPPPGAVYQHPLGATSGNANGGNMYPHPPHHNHVINHGHGHGHNNHGHANGHNNHGHGHAHAHNHHAHGQAHAHAQAHGHHVPYIQAPAYDTKFMQSYSSDNTGGTASWSSRVPSDASHTVPTLITPRRGSVSSNEEHLPATPYHTYGGYAGDVAIMGRSPSGVGTANNTTPSPSSYLPGFPGIALNNKPYQPPAISVQLQLLLQQEPAIPRAIPAPSSPVKPLDRCLENKNGETNVYIRGLLPETTDDMLHCWGSRFGDIASSKSIIDHKSTSCKGFGFIKYHNFEDAENCIRGFHHLGYEVSFARESFYSKLKKFSDEGNTNLYVSNIPRNYNEHELSQAFHPFKVLSARILRDDRGNGRGVGFARFETRDVCEEVIIKYNNTPVSKPGGEEHIIQIRYSDTHEQKMLKQQTAAARQFRAAEFEYGCIEARRAGLLPQGSSERLTEANGSGSGSGSVIEFDQYIPQGFPATTGGAKPYMGQSLPTIKSENSASPGVSTPATVVKIDEGVALHRDLVDIKEPIVVVTQPLANITNGGTPVVVIEAH